MFRTAQASAAAIFLLTSLVLGYGVMDGIRRDYYWTPMERVVSPEDASNRVLIYVGAGGELVSSSTFSPPILIRLNNVVEATRTQLAVAMFLLGAGMALLVSFPATPLSRRQGPIRATTMILFAGMLFSGGGAVLAFVSAAPLIWQYAEWHRLSTVPASIIGALFGLVAGSVLVAAGRAWRPLWWFGVVAVFPGVLGFAGILLGLALHPNSNLLGGYGLTFGPILWRGQPVAVTVVLVYITVWAWCRLIAPRLATLRSRKCGSRSWRKNRYEPKFHI